MENIIWPDWLNTLYIVGGGIILQQVLYRLLFPWLEHKKGAATNSRGIVLSALEMPVSLLIITTALYFGFYGTPVHLAAPELFLRVYRSATIFAFFHILYNLSSNQQNHLASLADRFNIKLDPILSSILSDIFRVLIFIIGFLTLIREWNYDISGLIAGLGLGGLALAMASKDSLANIFGGFIILTDKPFRIGDWIQTAGIEGVVEEVSFRSTRVRTFEQALVYVPNSNLTNIAITNFSRRSKRRAKFAIGLTYATSKQQMLDCLAAISGLLADNPNISQTPGDTVVAFSEYGDSSLNISIIFFTLAIGYEAHTRAREAVNLAIMDIVEKVGVSMAFPSRSLYLETPLPANASAPKR